MGYFFLALSGIFDHSEQGRNNLIIYNFYFIDLQI